MVSIQPRAQTSAKLFAIEVEKQKARDAEDLRVRQAEAELQELMDSIAEAKIEREKKQHAAEIEYKTALDKLRADAENRAANNMKIVLEAIGPDLAASMSMQSNKEIVAAIAESISPYALANGKSVSAAVNEMLRGTTLEKVVESFTAAE